VGSILGPDDDRREAQSKTSVALGSTEGGQQDCFLAKVLWLSQNVWLQFALQISAQIQHSI
jgi:hypothetical protein